MQLSKETLQSPLAISGAYFCIACLVIMCFRIIFPGEVPPLPVFSRDWRLVQGLLEIITLFPALAFSALVLPFAFVSLGGIYDSGSSHPFQRLMTPLITAISAAGLYALLFFLVLPLTQNVKDNMRFESDVYHLAKERAQSHREAGEWLEVSQFIGICESVWANSPEITALKNDLEINQEKLWYTAERNQELDIRTARRPSDASILTLPGQKEPVNASEAIALGEIALSEGRPLDAHWLATLGGRIAKENSPEKTIAAQLAGRAWNQIESQQPTNIEASVYSLYQLKLSGYEAMVSSDWIQAYYIFKELTDLTPNDPDVANFLAVSERGTKEVAFFIDEIDIALGKTIAGTIFSLPTEYNHRNGRAVMRISGLSTSADFAYGIGVEYMVFDSQANPLLSLQAPYAKILPIILNGQHKVLFLMRALDRHDSTKRWEPKWNALDTTVYHSGSAQIILNVNYETFLMLSEIRQELSSMYIYDLFASSQIARDMGYIPEVYEAEILNRLSSCLFFLPMSVITIIIGWRFRARYRQHYFFIVLLPILPLVFNAITYLYRTILNSVGISLILAVGFSRALTAFIVILVLSFILSLFLLTAQHD